MWKQRGNYISLLRSCFRKANSCKAMANYVHSERSLFSFQTPIAYNNNFIRRFTTTAENAIATEVTSIPGEMVDEIFEERPELYAVPITPPSMSISGRDVGLKPMSLEDFRKKISNFQNSDRWKEFNTDEGVIENERADILADRIDDLLSNRKQKFIFKEFQKFIMLPSPVDRQALIKMLRTIDDGLGEVSPSLLPWVEAYFNGTDFPEAGEDLREVQIQLDALTKVTEKFFRDWEFHLFLNLIGRNIQYDGFQWRVNVVRDCIESYVSDDESKKLYEFFNSFSDSPRKSSSLSQFLSRVSVFDIIRSDPKTILKFNEHNADLIALIEWVIKGLNDFPLISISAVQSNEARLRDAERHTLISAYNKYRYHSKSISDTEQEKGALLLSFRLSTLLDDSQHKLFVSKLSDYQTSAMTDTDLQLFIRAACQICGRAAYLVEPSIRQYVEVGIIYYNKAQQLSIPTIEHVRRMKKPVLTVKAVCRYCSPGADVEAMLKEDTDRPDTPPPGDDRRMKRRRKVLLFQSNSTLDVPNGGSLYQVFVHNLPLGITTEELAKSFRNCGQVTKVEILDYSNPEDTEVAKKTPRIRQLPTESRIYGFIHFDDMTARERALIPAMRVFGVQIRDCLCRTEPAENKRTLFIGNIDKGVTGEEVSSSLNGILKPHLCIELQDVPSPGIITMSAGYCFIEFDSHQLASMSFSLLSGAVVNGKELKVGWALDSTDSKRRKQEYKWDTFHF